MPKAGINFYLFLEVRDSYVYIEILVSGQKLLFFDEKCAVGWRAEMSIV